MDRCQTSSPNFVLFFLLLNCFHIRNISSNIFMISQQSPVTSFACTWWQPLIVFCSLSHLYFNMYRYKLTLLFNTDTFSPSLKSPLQTISFYLLSISLCAPSTPDYNNFKGKLWTKRKHIPTQWNTKSIAVTSVKCQILALGKKKKQYCRFFLLIYDPVSTIRLIINS